MNEFQEVPAPVENLQYPPRYTDLQTLLSDSGVKEKANKGRNPELEAQYPHRFFGKDGNTKVEVQLRDEDSEAAAYTVKVGEEKIKVVARVWFTEKTGEKGKGSAVCYKLGENGKWYKQTAAEYKYDKDKNTNYWGLSKVEELADEEAQIGITSRLTNVFPPKTTS